MPEGQLIKIFMSSLRLIQEKVKEAHGIEFELEVKID
jgi:UDP-N-acetylenolpyruvoylglucosamine reductase